MTRLSDRLGRPPGYAVNELALIKRRLRTKLVGALSKVKSYVDAGAFLASAGFPVAAPKATVYISMERLGAAGARS